MTNDVRWVEVPRWFRWVVLGTLGVIAFVIAVVGLLVPAPNGHPLLAKPTPLTLAAIQFEVGYFTYLATLTGGVVVAMLTFLQLDPKPGIWRTAAITSVFSFMVALALVTVGYAMRNIWVTSQMSLDPHLVSIDAFADGPITAALYIVGLTSMLVSVWNRYS